MKTSSEVPLNRELQDEIDQLCENIRNDDLRASDAFVEWLLERFDHVLHAVDRATLSAADLYYAWGEERDLDPANVSLWGADAIRDVMATWKDADYVGRLLSVHKLTSRAGKVAWLLGFLSNADYHGEPRRVMGVYADLSDLYLDLKSRGYLYSLWISPEQSVLNELKARGVLRQYHELTSEELAECWGLR